MLMRSKVFAAATGAAAFWLATIYCPALAETRAPDYARTQNWASLPKTPNKKVDVFWVYSTAYNGKAVVAAIDDAQMRQGAAFSLLSQASVFADSANIFAPLYRQSNVSVLSMEAATQKRYLDVGLSDVKAAFPYYLQHLNHGRPFILAGHSQGANLLTDLARQEPNKPALRGKLVAAYLIGWLITRQDLQQYPFLKICRSAGQTGCIVTYNSIAAGFQKKAPTILPGAVSANPLSWRTDGKLVPASENLGAVIFDADGKRHAIAHFTSARNVDGALVVTPKSSARLTHLPFGPGVYHAYDYNLFYENLKANVARRIKAFATAGARKK